MTTCNSIRVVANGRFVSGPWLGEIAQVGVSLIGQDGLGIGGGSPVIGATLPTFDAAPASGTTSVSGLGSVSLGSEGADAWTEANQILVAEAFYDYLTAVKLAQVNTFQWDELRLSAIATDGSVVNGATVVTLSPVLTGGHTSQVYSPETAIVQSWVSGARGAKGKGRLYLPLTGDPTGWKATGALNSSTAASAMNTAMNTFYDAIMAIPSDRLRMAVVSRTTGTWSDITQFRVGTHMDTQRRRDNRIPETYYSLSV